MASSFAEAWMADLTAEMVIFLYNRDLWQLTLDPTTQTGAWGNPHPKWTNWFENVEFVPDHVFLPQTRDDLVAIVQRASAENRRIRVAGSCISYNELANCADYVVYMGLLNRSIELNRAKRQVTVEAGIMMAELAKFCSSSGLSLGTTTVIPWIQAGGAVAVGCHGTGRFYQSVGDQVVEMEMVLANGTVKKFHRETPAANTEMNAALVNLGSLGLIYSLTFQCEPKFALRAVDEKPSLAWTLANIRNIVDTNDYVELFWFPFNTDCWIKRWNPVPSTPQDDLIRYHQDVLFQLLGQPFADPFMEAIAQRPENTPTACRMFHEAVEEKTRVSVAPVIMHYQCQYLKVWDMSYAFPIDPAFTNFTNAWNVVMNRVNAEAAAGRYPMNMPMHARFLKGSDQLLSPMYGHSGLWCALEITTHRSTREPLRAQFFQSVENDWAALPLLSYPHARPHWGKVYPRSSTPAGIAAVNATYPTLPAFQAMRNALDPFVPGVGRRFVNPYSEAIFGP